MNANTTGDEQSDTAVASVSISTGSGQKANRGVGLGAPLVAVVKNATGAPLPGVAVNWTISAGPGTLGGGSSVSDSDGLASMTFTAGTRFGPSIVTATAHGTSISASFSEYTVPVGKFYVAGGLGAMNGIAINHNLTRLDTDGSVDTTFNPGGYGFDNWQMSKVIEELDATGLPSGNVLVTGDNDGTSYNGVATHPGGPWRVSATGVLDTAFNSSGVGADHDTMALMQELGASGLPTGQLFLGGFHSNYNGTSSATLTKLGSSGVQDAVFNNGQTGFSAAEFPVLVHELSTTTGLPTGKLIVSAPMTFGATLYNGVAVNDHTLIRIDSVTGALDTSYVSDFGTFFGFYSSAHELSPATGLPTGGLLIGGGFGAPCISLCRVNSDGTWDAAFNNGVGANGAVFAILPELSSTSGLPTGKVYIAGQFTQYRGTAITGIARIHADGTLDTAFNNGGAGLGGGFGWLGQAIALDYSTATGLPTGKIYVGGDFTTYNGATVPSGLIRLNADGTVDASFNLPGTGLTNWVNSVLFY